MQTFHTFYDDPLCVMRFISDDTKHLMLNFKRFLISGDNINLTISGTSSGDVSLNIVNVVLACSFRQISRAEI